MSNRADQPGGLVRFRVLDYGSFGFIAIATKIGAYSDGVIPDALLAEGFIDYAWLSASRGSFFIKAARPS